MEAFLKSNNRKGIALECSNIMGDEHKGIIKWTDDIGVEYCLCSVNKSGEILSKY